MAVRTSVATGLWSAAGTWDTGVPVDGDSAVIAAGHVVTFDVDQSAWVTGLVGLTITSHATTPGQFVASETAGAYVLKMGANAQIVGTNATAKGILRAGTSKAVPYPNTCSFTLIMGTNAANSAATLYAQYLKVQLFCSEPTIKYVTLTASAIVGATALSVDQDVSADATRPWVANDYVVCGNAVTTGTRTTDTRQIASVAGTTINLAVGLTYALPQYSVIALRTRNISIFTDSIESGVYNVVDVRWDNGHVIYAEITNRLFTSLTGTFYETSGTHGRLYAIFRAQGTFGTIDIDIGGTITGCEVGVAAIGAKVMSLGLTAVFIGCDNAIGYGHSYGADCIFLCCNYTGTGSLYGRVKIFCNVRGFERSSGSLDSGSLVEWTANGLGSFAPTLPTFFDGTLKNCGIIGGGFEDAVFGKNARVGQGCTTGYTMYTGKLTMYGCRLNHATPVSVYSGIADPFSRVIGYDYADSSDVPQYGQIRAWMGAGIIAPDTTPASPPSGLVAATCHKMSHEYAGLDLKIDVPLVLEAGTPLDITVYVKLNSGAYSWTTEPVFELFDPAVEFQDATGVIAEAVDANGDPLDATSAAWQTLYLKYTLPIATNRPLGAKQNFVLRVRGRVSDATGTPYWHWNYTQSAVVNANVQYIEGEDATDALAKATCRFRGGRP